jgi:AcrR family transcriptional regulator
MPTSTRPGRPREERVDTAVLTVVDKLIAKVGYAALTVDAVALEAGVSKAAIYRRWRSKGALVYAAVVARQPVPEITYSGDIAADLGTIAATNVLAFRDADARELMLALLADAFRDAQLAADLRTEYFGPRAAQIKELVVAAVGAGELSASVPADLIPAMLTGPMLYITMVYGRPPDDTELSALVTAAIGPYHRR